MTELWESLCLLLTSVEEVVCVAVLIRWAATFFCRCRLLKHKTFPGNRFPGSWAVSPPDLSCCQSCPSDTHTLFSSTRSHRDLYTFGLFWGLNIYCRNKPDSLRNPPLSSMVAVICRFSWFKVRIFHILMIIMLNIWLYFLLSSLMWSKTKTAIQYLMLYLQIQVLSVNMATWVL